MEYRNLNELRAYNELANSGKCSIKTLLSKERVAACSIPAGGSLTYNYAAMPVSDEQVRLLQALADEDELVAKYKAVLSGEMMKIMEGLINPPLHQSLTWVVFNLPSSLPPPASRNCLRI